MPLFFSWPFKKVNWLVNASQNQISTFAKTKIITRDSLKLMFQQSRKPTKVELDHPPTSDQIWQHLFGSLLEWKGNLKIGF